MNISSSKLSLPINTDKMTHILQGEAVSDSKPLKKHKNGNSYRKTA
jgi:hypothetical protein